MKTLDIANNNCDLQQTAKMLYEACKHKSQYESNWMFAQNDFICCFKGKILYLTDTNFRPLLMYESTSFIVACGISRTGKYIVCQTAYNHENDEDSGTTIIFDVEKRAIICRKCIEIGVNSTRIIFVDEQKKVIAFYVADRILGNNKNIVVKYDFELNPDEETLKEYYRKPDISPYLLNARVQMLIEKMKNEIIQWHEVDQEIIYLLERLKDDDDMSHYQLSMTYKQLGDLYSKYDNVEKAILSYETGLLLNPKLAVKRKLNQLKKENPTIEITKPYIASIEREKNREKEEYTLPSTYDKDWQQKKNLYIEQELKRMGIEKTDSTYKDSKTYKNTSVNDKKLIDNAVKILKQITDNFFAGLQNESEEFVNSFEGLNDMSDEEFNFLFNGFCKCIDKSDMIFARKSAENTIRKRSQDSQISTVREEIMKNLYYTLEHYKNKQ